jgi:hypothetical protein
MNFGALLAALTVTVDEGQGLGCPTREAIVQRLSALGVTVREEEDVRVRFSLEKEKRIAVIDMPGAVPRRVEHEGPDCSSLGDATVALLSVLLDERAPTPPGPPPRDLPPGEPESRAVLRVEGGVLVSSGIVAPLAAGATAGVAWRPVRWGSIGLAAETWPGRDHIVRDGTVTVSASSLALAACIQLWRELSVEGCALGHGGVYSLSGQGFPTVRSTDRALVGAEADVRAALSIAKGVSVFVRAGIWLPLTRLDVTVRGAESGFSTTSLGPKGALGLELNL